MNERSFMSHAWRGPEMTEVKTADGHQRDRLRGRVRARALSHGSMRPSVLIGFVVIVSSALVACSEPAAEAIGAQQPEGWDDDVRLTSAVDHDPSDDVVEIDLVARVEDLELRAGTTTPVWTYDGRLPGPLVRASAGDRLIVHFRNELAVETTIHWHGMRVPVAMDGAPGHSQPPIAAGATFDYEFVIPDAGLFWYHPHIDSAKQVGNGLYGALLIDDPAEPEGLGDEVVLVLSDIGVEADGSLSPPDSGGELGDLFGREGNLLLVNGKVRPTLHARAGMRQRWRIVNAARSRYFQLALDGHRFTRIGGDGGRSTQPVETDRPVIVPGERADLVVVPDGPPGSEIVVRWVPYDRGYGSTFNRPEEDLFVLRFADAPRVEAPPLPDTSRAIDAISGDAAEPVDLTLTLGKDASGAAFMGINGVPFSEAEPIMAMVGKTQLWTVTNQTDWAHPFHLHGFFFQVVDSAKVPVHPLEWKDTVDVPVDATLRLLVDYDDRPGMWMFHCHILDHAEIGMMGMLHLQ